MKGLIKYSAFLVALFLVVACNNDDDLQVIQVNETFTAVINQRYICNTVDGDITMEITNIKDERIRGNACDVVFPGGVALVDISIDFEAEKYEERLGYLGCTVTEGEPSQTSLPSIEFKDGYILRMLSITPYSPLLTNEEEVPLKNYQMKFIIIK